MGRAKGNRTIFGTFGNWPIGRKSVSTADSFPLAATNSLRLPSAPPGAAAGEDEELLLLLLFESFGGFSDDDDGADDEDDDDGGVEADENDRATAI